MSRKDPRTPEEKAQWEAGEITQEEADEAGGDVNEMNQVRENVERDSGNPLAPPG